MKLGSYSKAQECGFGLIWMGLQVEKECQW